MELLKITELVPHPQNSYYFDDISGDAWDEFLQSIKTSGVIEPVIATQTKVIVSGHQRVRACRQLNIPEIKVIINEYENEDAILKDLIETNIRQRGVGNPNPVKFGRCIRELERIYGIQHGGDRKSSGNNCHLINTPQTQPELAKVLGISVKSLNNYKKLTDLIPELQESLNTGTITATTALAISRQLSKEDQLALISQLDSSTQYTNSKIQKYIDEIKSLRENPQLPGDPEKLKKETTTIEPPSDYESLKQQVSTLSHENALLNEEKNNLASELKAKNEDIDYLIKEGSAESQTKIDELSKQLDELQFQIETLDDELNSRNTEIARLTEEKEAAILEASAYRKDAMPVYNETINSNGVFEFCRELIKFQNEVVAPFENGAAISAASDHTVYSTLERTTRSMIDTLERILRKASVTEVVIIE